MASTFPLSRHLNALTVVCRETNRCSVQLLPMNSASPSPETAHVQECVQADHPLRKGIQRKCFHSMTTLIKYKNKQMHSHKALHSIKQSHKRITSSIINLSVTPDWLMILNIHLKHISLAHVLCRSCRFAGRAQHDTHPDEHGGNS